MKIRQILNNNVALVSRGENEAIVYVKGLAFKKKVGEKITESEIQKTYVLDSNDMLEHFSYLLAHTDPSLIILVNDIIDYGEALLEERANDYLSLTLLDHIEFALKRARKQQFIRSPLTWEVKKFYQKHFEIGLHALHLMEERFGVEFPEDEAVSFALHFVNMQESKSNLKQMIHAMETLRDILSIIQYHYTLSFDETSMNYMRLVTHLQYFIQRLYTKTTHDSEHDRMLYEQVIRLYPKARTCVEKIAVYVQTQFACQLSIDEETYLILHVHRVTNRE